MSPDAIVPSIVAAVSFTCTALRFVLLSSRMPSLAPLYFSIWAISLLGSISTPLIFATSSH